MAKKTKTRLTFSLSIDMPSGMNIPKVRAWIKDSLLHYQGHESEQTMADVDLSNVKVHLLNKETSYG